MNSALYIVWYTLYVNVENFQPGCSLEDNMKNASDAELIFEIENLLTYYK